MAEYVKKAFLLEGIDLSIVAAKAIADGDSVALKAVDIMQTLRDFVANAPAADVAPVAKELRPAVRLLHKEYERAKENPIVRNPLAYALYQVWKAVDDCENGR